MITLGIMQGRLSPPVRERIQAFPSQTWRREFALAREAGLGRIELVYERETAAEHPLSTDDGVIELRNLGTSSGVEARSVCADYFMEDRLIGPGGNLNREAVEHLRWLLHRCVAVGAGYVVLPFVDQSALRSAAEQAALIDLLEQTLASVGHASVEIHLETDLPPKVMVRLLERMNHYLVRANYDTGNSAALGRDPSEELVVLGPWLGSVHIKDRIRGGGSVTLGTGNADFQACFRIFRAIGFVGPFILQTARESGLSEVALAARNRHFVEGQVAASGEPCLENGPRA